MENQVFQDESDDTPLASSHHLHVSEQPVPTTAPSSSHSPGERSPRMKSLTPHYMSVETPSPDFLHLLRYFEEPRFAAELRTQEQRRQVEQRWREEERKCSEEERRWRQKEADRRQADSECFLLMRQGLQASNQTLLAASVPGQPT